MGTCAGYDFVARASHPPSDTSACALHAVSSAGASVRALDDASADRFAAVGTREADVTLAATRRLPSIVAESSRNRLFQVARRPPAKVATPSVAAAIEGTLAVLSVHLVAGGARVAGLAQASAVHAARPTTGAVVQAHGGRHRLFAPLAAKPRGAFARTDVMRLGGILPHPDPSRSQHRQPERRLVTHRLLDRYHVLRVRFALAHAGSVAAAAALAHVMDLATLDTGPPNFAGARSVVLAHSSPVAVGGAAGGGSLACNAAIPYSAHAPRPEAGATTMAAARAAEWARLASSPGWSVDGSERLERDFLHGGGDAREA